MLKTPEEAMRKVADGLRSIDAPHMLVGALSSNFYGVPRATKDMDVVVQVPVASLDRLFLILGDDFIVNPQPSFETVTGTFRHELEARGLHFRVELFQLSDDAHDRERFRRRLNINYPALGGMLSIPTAEDVIIMKLRWARPKDLEDVRDILAVQGDAVLDWPYLHRWTAEHRTRDRLEDIRSSIPPIT